MTGFRRLVAVLAASLFVLSAAALVGVRATAARAEVGSGWTQYKPSMKLQIQSKGEYTNFPGTVDHASGPGGSFDRSGNVEKFRLFNGGASNRVEMRIQEEYSSGHRQFEGDLRVSSPTNNESCMQIFGRSGGGAALMIRAYSGGGGSLRALGMGATIATGVYGKWVHLNVVHDANASKVTIYVDGKSKGTWSVPNHTHYFKYGIYGTLKTSSAQTEWRNVKFFKK